MLHKHELVVYCFIIKLIWDNISFFIFFKLPLIEPGFQLVGGIFRNITFEAIKSVSMVKIYHGVAKIII